MTELQQLFDDITTMIKGIEKYFAQYLSGDWTSED